VNDARNLYNRGNDSLSAIFGNAHNNIQGDVLSNHFQPSFQIDERAAQQMARDSSRELTRMELRRKSRDELIDIILKGAV
jgi:hypothetical protein